MKKIAAYTIAGSILVAFCNSACAEECTRTKVAKGPTGITKVVCLDGKYSTCLRDSQSIGWSRDQALRFCDERRRLGRIK
jgi:hypothetical protein